MHLRRIDPDRNMARFYTMSLQPTLFGEWALLREWGRIGSAGRLVSGRFASEQQAALESLIKMFVGHLGQVFRPQDFLCRTRC
jgi:predicted DNA-binding WGR domain protein